MKLNYSNKSSTGVPTLVDSKQNFTDDKSKACLLNEYFDSQSTLDLLCEPELPINVVKPTMSILSEI